ncbi:MAG TPA: DAK2 domain-containing protein, partial [Actinomycetes bacterium]|nr:DAK2 domain-containing protein [Actinomycetes bacterium]
MIEQHAANLTRLDSAIGDGDHGTNMNRGYKAAVQRLDSL